MPHIFDQIGGTTTCTLCGSVGTNKSTCPLNQDIPMTRQNPDKHPLARQIAKSTLSKIPTTDIIPKRIVKLTKTSKSPAVIVKQTVPPVTSPVSITKIPDQQVPKTLTKTTNVPAEVSNNPSALVQTVPTNTADATNIDASLIFHDIDDNTDVSKLTDTQLLKKLQILHKVLSGFPISSFLVMQTRLSLLRRLDSVISSHPSKKHNLKFAYTYFQTDFRDLYKKLSLSDKIAYQTYKSNYLRELLYELIDTANIVGDTNSLEQLRNMLNSVNHLIKQQDPAYLDLIIRTRKAYEIAYLSLKQGLARFAKTCKNKLTPVQLENTDDVDESDFIRLSSGACWDIDSLIHYIKEGSQGKNTILTSLLGITDYPSDKIWLINHDFDKIIQHPKARQAKLFEFIKSRETYNNVSAISVETAKKFLWAGSLLWSRGDPFNGELANYMTASQLKRWNELKGKQDIFELPDAIRYPQTELDEDVKNVINGVIKSHAITVLSEYYGTLSKTEREAIDAMTPGISKLIHDCHAGNECVMVGGSAFVRFYNTIAEHKGLPPADYGKGSFYGR